MEKNREKNLLPGLALFRFPNSKFEFEKKTCWVLEFTLFLIFDGNLFEKKHFTIPLKGLYFNGELKSLFTEMNIVLLKGL